MTLAPARPPRMLPGTWPRSALLSGGLFALMLAIRGWLQWVGPLPGDRATAAHDYVTAPVLPSWVIDVYVQVAKPWACAVLLILGLIVLSSECGLRAAAGLVLAEFVIVFNALLKAIFGPTPLWAIGHGGATNYPSGHASYAIGVYGYLLWIAVRQLAGPPGDEPGRRRPWWALLALVCLIVVIGMGPERVLSGTHLPSDVIGGYLLAGAWLALIIPWVRRGLSR